MDIELTFLKELGLSNSIKLDALNYLSSLLDWIIYYESFCGN